jgi:hypothetical protein
VTDLASYVNKTVLFKFNGAELRFDLSHALFSSFDIDVGTRLLLKTAARDPVLASARRILDEGCGVGVIGLCAAKAFPEAEVVLRDRDSLAVAFAERNRLANRLRGVAAWKDPETGAERVARPAPRVEPGLLCDSREFCGEDRGEDRGFDFVFSNLPAKAGGPVLAYFFDRLSGKAGGGLLVPGGRAAVVIVNPLADSAVAWISESGLDTVATARGGMHRVFVVERRAGGPPEQGQDGQPGQGPSTPPGPPQVYLRSEARFKLADHAYRAAGFWGLPEFDTPGYGTEVAAELMDRVRQGTAFEGARFGDALFIEPGVGHLALWASVALRLERVTAASRDALALLAVGANLSSLPERSRPAFAAADALGAADLPAGSFDLIAESPDIVPERDWAGPAWDLAGRLLRGGGVYLVHGSPTDMTRLEKRRPTGGGRWSLLGQKRKKGFVAMAWRKT